MERGRAGASPPRFFVRWPLGGSASPAQRGILCGFAHPPRRPRSPLVPALTCALAAAVVAPLAIAQDGGLGSEPAAPAEAPDAEATRIALELLGERPRQYGEADSLWVTLGLGYANDFGDNKEGAAYAGLSWFLFENVETSIELGGSMFDQVGRDAFGLTVSHRLRWHFISTPDWSVYGETGFGLMLASPNVPDGGTSLNFLPTVGAGVTRALTQSSRLELGVRWRHISNARVAGDIRNPSREAVMIYAGVIFAF